VPIAQTPQQVRSSFNPFKILIPSAAALLVVFAVIFAFTREQAPPANSNVNQPSLVPDPNSQPVQPKQAATGKGEEGIPAGGTIAPSTNVNAAVNANVSVSPSPLEAITPIANANVNENANTNTNSNRKAPALPEPTKTVTPEGPAPAPPGTKPPDAKPSPSAAASPGQT